MITLSSCCGNQNLVARTPQFLRQLFRIGKHSSVYEDGFGRLLLGAISALSVFVNSAANPTRPPSPGDPVPLPTRSLYPGTVSDLSRI
jgi:hypothetical protein